MISKTCNYGNVACLGRLSWFRRRFCDRIYKVLAKYPVERLIMWYRSMFGDEWCGLSPIQSISRIIPAIPTIYVSFMIRHANAHALFEGAMTFESHYTVAKTVYSYHVIGCHYFEIKHLHLACCLDVVLFHNFFHVVFVYHHMSVLSV